MEENSLIEIIDFTKIKLKVGKILSAEKVTNSDKLLKLQVGLGDKQIQILSGIAQWYDPTALVGVKILVVTNLTPVKLRGEMSEGMLLCAKNEVENRYSLIRLEDGLATGSIVSWKILLENYLWKN